MRRVILLGTAAFLGILVFVPALGAASQADLVVTTGIPAKLYGHIVGTTGQGILRLGYGSEEVRLDGHGTTIETVRITSSYARLPVADVSGERRVETRTTHVAAGALGIYLAQSDGFIAAEGDDARLQSMQAYANTPHKNFWSAANAQLSGLISTETVTAPLPPQKLAQISSGHAPSMELAASSYALTASGPFKMDEVDRLIVYGARIVAPDGSTLVAESTRTISEQPGSAYVPGPDGGSWVGPGTHVEEVVEVLQITAPAASLSGKGPATLYASDLRIHSRGFIGFPWAQGALETANESIDLNGEQVILGGDLWLRPIGFDASIAPQITLLGNGDVEYAKIGVASQRLDGAEAAAVAGGAAAGIGLVALLVYFWPVVKYGASLALFPLYARVPKENTLDHKGRELLYDLIKNEPGVSTNKLAKEVPFGWSTLTYHLRVLERNEAIVSVRDGRYKRFFDRQSGRFANGRKYILAVLKNDATFDIARYIRAKPGSSQKEVATSFELSPSSVHWHVERLTEVGLVSKSREAHNVKYFPGEAWGHVTVEDLKALEEAGPEPAEESPKPPEATGELGLRDKVLTT